MRSLDLIVDATDVILHVILYVVRHTATTNASNSDLGRERALDAVAHRRRGGHHASDVSRRAGRRVGLHVERHVARRGEPLRLEGHAVELARLALFLTRGLGGRALLRRRREPLEDV